MIKRSYFIRRSFVVFIPILIAGCVATSPVADNSQAKTNPDSEKSPAVRVAKKPQPLTLSQREKLVWDEAVKINTFDAYRNFLISSKKIYDEKHPSWFYSSEYRKRAYEKMHQLDPIAKGSGSRAQRRA